ncbi:MAG: DUF692 domain-containing protein [Gammaproteobacteria bacterium]
MFSSQPRRLGVGINYTTSAAANICKNINTFDFIEVSTERFFIDHNNDKLDYIIENLPTVLHGLTLSLGASQTISENYLHNLKSTLGRINCEWFSEHIGLTNINGLEIRSLMPTEFTDQSVSNIVTKAKQIMALTNKPFLLENISYYFTMPNNNMSEVDFIQAVVKGSDCGLLLDLNNLYVNSINHKYDPYDFVDKLPLDRVVEVHLAGCEYMNGMLIDTHASHTKNEVLSLFEYVCDRAKISGVIIERDAKLDDFSLLVDEVNLVRGIFDRAYGRLTHAS